MKKQIRKYSIAGLIFSSLIAISTVLVAINQYRLNLPTGFLEFPPTVLGAIVILVYIAILVMPVICLIGIIKPEAFMKYPVKLMKQNQKDLDLKDQFNNKSLTKMFSFKNTEYSKLFADANRNAIINSLTK
jgi:hypothetical protein